MDIGLDMIGDIHGHSAKLEALLGAMGYTTVDGIWRHPARRAVFLGDFIDRGPDQIGVYRIVRAMVEAGSALAVLGNHEWNAIAFHTPDGLGGHLRQRSVKNLKQHREFTDQAGMDSPLHGEIIAWFRTLPLWLELDGIRAVHACWDEDAMRVIEPYLTPDGRISDALIRDGSTGTGNAWEADGTRPAMTPAFHAVETLLKGVEVELPAGTSYQDADGHARTATRVSWWHGPGSTYRSSALVPSRIRDSMPDLDLPTVASAGYAGTKPLFIGHYWMTDVPTVLAPNIACVDYSAGKGGPLVAYRWSGEKVLDDGNFIATD